METVLLVAVLVSGAHTRALQATGDSFRILEWLFDSDTAMVDASGFTKRNGDIPGACLRCADQDYQYWKEKHIVQPRPFPFKWICAPLFSLLVPGTGHYFIPARGSVLAGNLHLIGDLLAMPLTALIGAGIFAAVSDHRQRRWLEEGP